MDESSDEDTVRDTSKVLTPVLQIAALLLVQWLIEQSATLNTTARLRENDKNVDADNKTLEVEIRQ